MPQEPEKRLGFPLTWQEAMNVVASLEKMLHREVTFDDFLAAVDEKLKEEKLAEGK